MLRYINKQLSVKELHEVEKHMLDCELCTDALAGMKYAENSSVLFAIDNQIDQRVRGGQQKSPVMRNLMVAASLLVIVFGSYFTFNFFNETIDSEANIALNNKEGESENEELKTLEDEMSYPPSSLMEEKSEDGELNSAGNVLSDNIDAEETIIEQPAMVEEVEDMELDNTIVSAEIVEVEDEEEAEADDFRYRNEVALKKEVAKGEAQVATSTGAKNNRNKSLGLGWTANNQESNNAPAENVRKKSEKKYKDQSKKDSNKKTKLKVAKEAPSFEDQDVAFSQDDNLSRNQNKVIVISDFKAIDYTEEYQKEFDMKQVVETKSISADFATEKDKELAEKERDELLVEITYKSTLEKAMAYYKNAKYTLALEQFNIILKEHPEEVNGLFYGGLSNYQLRRYNKANESFDAVLTNEETEFNQEARWYKALTLIKLKKNDKAKIILKGIIAENGFYKAKAEDKLKELQ
jgi:hypothetical protein